MLAGQRFIPAMGRARDIDGGGDGEGGRVSYSRMYVCVYIGMKVFILDKCFIAPK